MLFVPLWSLIVYYPLAHMVWGEAACCQHRRASTSPAATSCTSPPACRGLVACLMLGKRKNHGLVKYRAAQRALRAAGRGAAVVRLVRLQRRQRAGGQRPGRPCLHDHEHRRRRGDALLDGDRDDRHHGKPTVLGAATGLVVGLVAITPGAGFVPVWAAIIIGLVVSPLCWFGVSVIEAEVRLRRRAGRLRLPRHRRHLGRHRHGPVRPDLASIPSPHGTALCSATGTCFCAARRHRHHDRAGGRRDIDRKLCRGACHQGTARPKKSEDVGLDGSQHGEIGLSVVHRPGLKEGYYK